MSRCSCYVGAVGTECQVHASRRPRRRTQQEASVGTTATSAAMEMLAEMEGTDEDLKGLNEAEHKPEDDMQTDEWMYELKHRKSWSTGRYVPSGGDGGDPKADEAQAHEFSLRLSTTHLEDGGRIPGIWQERLSEDQVKSVTSVWAAVDDKTAFGAAVHEAILNAKRECGNDIPAMDTGRQAVAISDTLTAAVGAITSAASATLPQVFDSLSARYREYDLTDAEIFTIFCEAILGSLKGYLGEKFTPEARATWGESFQLLTSIYLEQHFV